VLFSSMLVQTESAAQAMPWEQQFCLPHVSHAVSPGAGAHEAVPPLLLPLLPPLLLPLVTAHCESQLVPPQATRAANAGSCPSHWVQASPVQVWSQVTQAWSLLHAVACVQHDLARHAAHSVVPVTAGQEPPPELPPEPELEQPPEEDVEPPPIPPPIPPPVELELQLLLPPLLDEHPRSPGRRPAAATTVEVMRRRITEFIVQVLLSGQQ
jgi:hypothetical protein